MIDQLTRFAGRLFSLLCSRSSFAAVVVALTSMIPASGVRGAAVIEDAAQSRFRELVPWTPKDFLALDEVVAFEEHAQFVYMAGRLTTAAKPPESVNRSGDARIRLVFLRPATLIVDVLSLQTKYRGRQPTAMRVKEVALGHGQTAQRAYCLYQAPEAREKAHLECHLVDNHVDDIVVTTDECTLRLSLPLTLHNAGRIAIDAPDGRTILASRHLPSGVLPYGTEGMRLMDSWDSRYRNNARPDWDKGSPSTHLIAAVETGAIKPGRTVELGCGTGTNAIYLAKHGFEVSAIDVAPTAIVRAEQQAAQAGVQVRWLLASVLAPPSDLKTFDVIFDRGCYHGVRRGSAKEYGDSLKRLSHPGTHVLILAGNANEERHYGPPRVTEEQLRCDFSEAFEFERLETVRFDSTDPARPGALAWFVLLRRKAGQMP